MNFMFSGALSFNGDISGWDTSSAIGLKYFFKDASSFNQDIGDWNTTNVNRYEFYV